jgi:hypothetical protein
MRLHVSTLALAALVAAGSALAQSTAEQTVVVPSLPGLPNQEVKISGQELSNAEMVGPELSFTGQVIQWEEGRSITMKFEDGFTRVVPVASNIIFPPDLRPGAPLTVLVRQTADGRYRVTGLRTGTPPPLPVPAAPPAAVAPAPAPAEASAPPPVATPPPPPPPAPKGKTVIGASYLTVHATIKAIDKESATIVQSNGTERTVKIAEKAVVAEGLKPGDKVVLRVPLQKPFDGKTADRIERPKPKKAPPPSVFSEAQSPKS